MHPGGESGPGDCKAATLLGGVYHIAAAKEDQMSAWEWPYTVEPRLPDESEPKMRHWDPDCFLTGDTCYAISGGCTCLS